MSDEQNINAAHPTLTGDHNTYAEALALVEPRHSKYDLVDLVNWLLVGRKKAEARVKELEMALDLLCSLKAHKDKFGKDTHYELAQPEAWRLANEVLNTQPKEVADVEKN